MNEMSITIHISCPEIVSAINNIAGVFTGGKAQNTMPAPTTQAIQAPVAVSQTVTPTAAQTFTSPIAPAQPIPTVQPQYGAPINQLQTSAPVSIPAYTINQLQTAIVPLLDAGKVQQIQSLVQSFGVSTLMDIPKERYGEFANGLRGLGGVL